MHKVKGFSSENIICKKCGCIDECQYYEETVKPVVKAYDSIGECANDEFEYNLITTVESMCQCEYYTESESK